MTIRKIIYIPNPTLMRESTHVETFDAKLQTLVNDMFDTMYNANGVGLAAPQIGINLQLAVVDVIGDRTQQFVLANPQIISSEGEAEYQEGCLSVPGAYDTVVRAKKVTVRAQDQFGDFFEMNAEGLLGECLQHEIDHLHGKLYIDLLSPLKRSMARKKSLKFQKQKARES